jgi:hypothetical protein
MLLPMVKNGGCYVIEDTYQDKGESLAKMFGGELYVGEKRPDDCMVVILR